MRNKDGSVNESANFLESLKAKKKKKSNKDGSDWTWRELSDLVKFTSVSNFCLFLFVSLLLSLSVYFFGNLTLKWNFFFLFYEQNPITSSLLKLNSNELTKLAVDCFISIMRYMGDHPMAKSQTEVDCVYTVLVVSVLFSLFSSSLSSISFFISRSLHHFSLSSSSSLFLHLSLSCI